MMKTNLMETHKKNRGERKRKKERKRERDIYR